MTEHTPHNLHGSALAFTDEVALLEREVQAEKMGPVTKIDVLIEESFADDALWQDDRGLPNDNVIGIRKVPLYDFDYTPAEWQDSAMVAKVKTDYAWQAALYGVRLVPETEKPVEGAVKAEIASVTTMIAIQEAIRDTILVDEHSRVGASSIPPVPEEGTNIPANNDHWLEQLDAGHWPLTATEVSPDGEILDYDDHDLTDYHSANMMLFPRELQDIISQTVRHERAWRKRHQAGEVPEKYLLLAGEKPSDQDVFGDSDRSAPYVTRTGIRRIDDVTDVPSYQPLIGYLVDGPDQSPQERLDVLLKSRDESLSVNRGYVQGLHDIRGKIGDLVNFNTRHSEGRNTTEEEVEAAFQGFLEGIVRVAQKIRV